MKRFYNDRSQFRSEHRRRLRRNATKQHPHDAPPLALIDERPIQLKKLLSSLARTNKEQLAVRALQNIAQSCAELVLRDTFVGKKPVLRNTIVILPAPLRFGIDPELVLRD